ncbi:NACHT, LRR and PYD domains-containing protein 3-like [Centropristis striata]|uniref:NACHT, LRR and PYD domains-containing protein 3-like n=1 Tax=Centropristis striata TaxID=184440 RepID=UPI0027E11976|nr:NACHT, LRR and PYD domains-containing protein 3-like [Centropristis striata]
MTYSPSMQQSTPVVRPVKPVTVTLDILIRMKLNLWAETLKNKYDEVPSNQAGKEINHHIIREKLKSTLRRKYQNIYEGNADERDTVYLKKIYTELHVIEGARGGFNEEHEVRQQRSNHVMTEETSIEVRDIKPKPNQEKRIRTVLTQGIPGSGKTVCAQKFTLSWAEGEENQDIAFLFPLSFREMNPNIGEKDYSLMQLLHQFFPEMKPLETLGTECKVLFIFDGLDETLLPLNFKHNKVLRDETEPASLDVLITNLITGDMLGNALIWITSRPAAGSRIPRKHIHQWTEVKGFATEQREEYFKKRLHDDNLAVRIINHVKSSRSLNIMCQIPVFCWITVTVMKKMLHNNVSGSMPNTLTELYAYLLLCQTDLMVEGHYPMGSDNVVLKLAELAFRQLEKGKLIFYEADLKECGIDVKEATIYSGVCTEIFVMEGRRRREVFSFVHLTIQEFLAAVYVHHSYMQRKENVLLGYLKRISTRWLPKSVFRFHKIAIEKALESPEGRWDLFLRFLLGLSLKSNQELLGRILSLEAEGEEAESEEDLAKTIQFIKEKIKEEPESKLNLFHCLSELKELSLVQEIQSFMSSGRLEAKKMDPVQWSALTFELMTSEATGEEFDLKKYIRSEEGVVKLLSVITSSTRALLNRCNITENCCEVLASALSLTSSHLTELDLSDNKLKNSGVKLLSVGLGSPHCKLRSLRLHKCKLEGDCCKALAVAVSTESNRLRDLDLSANDFQEAGVKALCVGLRSPHCKLETMRLNECKLKENCCADLASVLSASTSQMKTLDLSNNSLKDSGASLLNAGLKSPHCRLETLSVEHNAECYLKSTLKNYACTLALDTNTAAKSLYLYDDGKRVTWVRDSQQYPDHPERFESVSQVLCHQSLTQRHYWEVEWRGRWVDVAVAMRGIRRRASSHLCGFGSTHQSWSLYCSEDHYSAQHDHQPVEIPAPPSRSHRVGVYLDWPGGTLSFYSVSSGTLSHLHTFYSTFTEPLYPGFGMEEDDRSVTICTVESL